MNVTVERYALMLVAGFAAVSALGGGIGVATTNGLGMPLAWLRTTPFADYAVPGLILLIVVGGSASLATISLLKQHRWQYPLTFAAGVIMVGWIVGEVVLIQQTDWLQLVYFVVGLAMMGPATAEWLQSPIAGRHVVSRH